MPPVVAATEVCCYHHPFRTVLQGQVDGPDIRVQQLFRVIAALLQPAAYIIIQEHRERAIVNLDIAASEFCQVDQFLPVYQRHILPEFIQVRISGFTDGSPAAEYVSHVR